MAYIMYFNPSQFAPAIVPSMARLYSGCFKSKQ